MPTNRPTARTKTVQRPHGPSFTPKQPEKRQIPADSARSSRKRPHQTAAERRLTSAEYPNTFHQDPRSNRPQTRTTTAAKDETTPQNHASSSRSAANRTKCQSAAIRRHQRPNQRHRFRIQRSSEGTRMRPADPRADVARDAFHWIALNCISRPSGKGCPSISAR